LIVIEGALHRNSSVVPPEEFLWELRDRRTGRATRRSMF
jgi:hypothetical protein